MRKTLTALVIAASLPALALASANSENNQHRQFHGKGQHSQHERARGEHTGFKGLKLSAEQRQKIAESTQQLPKPHEITQKYLDKLPQADKDAMAKELSDTRAAREKAFRDALTPEQQQAFDQRKAAHEKRKAEREEFEAWKAEKAKKA